MIHLHETGENESLEPSNELDFVTDLSVMLIRFIFIQYHKFAFFSR